MTSSSGLYVLDTSILVHYARWNDVAKEVERNFQLITSLIRPWICEVSVGEARAFMLKNNWGQNRILRMSALLNLQRIDITSETIYQTYAEMDYITESNGRKMGKNDLWIAAATKAIGGTLLTADKDFDWLAGSMLSRVLVDADSGAVLLRS